LTLRSCATTLEARRRPTRPINRWLEDVPDQELAALLGVRDQRGTEANIPSAFLESEDPDKDVNLYINSPGGSITAGLAIYDTMQYVKPQVSTTCMGMAASMAALLLAAGAKGKRFSLPHSRIMIQQPSGGFGGQARWKAGRVYGSRLPGGTCGERARAALRFGIQNATLAPEKWCAPSGWFLGGLSTQMCPP